MTGEELNWSQVQYILSGFGLAAFMGLIPGFFFVYWFVTTFATRAHVDTGNEELETKMTGHETRIESKMSGHETRIRLLEIKQERQTAALEYLTQSLDRLNATLQHFTPRSPGLIMPNHHEQDEGK